MNIMVHYFMPPKCELSGWRRIINTTPISSADTIDIAQKEKKTSQKHLILQDCFILFDRARSQLELLYRGEEASEKESRYGNSDKNNVYCFISFGSLRKKAFAFGVI